MHIANSLAAVVDLLVVFDNEPIEDDDEPPGVSASWLSELVVDNTGAKLGIKKWF